MKNEGIYFERGVTHLFRIYATNFDNMQRENRVILHHKKDIFLFPFLTRSVNDERERDEKKMIKFNSNTRDIYKHETLWGGEWEENKKKKSVVEIGIKRVSEIFKF